MMKESISITSVKKRKIDLLDGVQVKWDSAIGSRVPTYSAGKRKRDDENGRSITCCLAFSQ